MICFGILLHEKFGKISYFYKFIVFKTNVGKKLLDFVLVDRIRAHRTHNTFDILCANRFFSLNSVVSNAQFLSV